MPTASGMVSKTMFYTEGNSTASLVIEKAGKPVEKKMEFKNAEAALHWCRQNGSNLYYMPVNIAHG